MLIKYKLNRSRKLRENCRVRERRGGNGKFIEEITVADQFEEKQLWRINAILITELRAFIYFGEGKRGKGRNSLQHSLRYVEGSCNTTSFYVTDVPRKGGRSN